MKRRINFFSLSKDERSGAATIFFLLFIGPLLLLGWIKVLSEIATENGWISVLMLVCYFLLTAILVSIVVPTFRHRRTRISFLSLGCAIMWLTGMYALGGVWILATGTTGGRVNFHAVPRNDSISYFVWAVLLTVIGLASITIGRGRSNVQK